ncbi:MAG: hypothetical protein ACK413_02495 [Patescibacteria group bacterium]
MDISFLKKEEEILSNFFGKKINLPWPKFSSEIFLKFSQLGFDLHFLPKIELSEEKNFPGWKEKPKKNFFNLIKEGKLPADAASLFGNWIFIDARQKPQKNNWWITKDDILVIILRKIFHFDFKKHYQKNNRQLYENDFLLPILKENGFSSRFSLSWREIEESIKPEAAKLLKIPLEKIRLPRFIEWNFLGNAFYPQWGKTSTWEWFDDRLTTGECLSGGYQSLNILGWDSPDYWSSILGFRFLIEI